jgi:hypothetical protein
MQRVQAGFTRFIGRGGKDSFPKLINCQREVLQKTATSCITSAISLMHKLQQNSGMTAAAIGWKIKMAAQISH